MKKGISVIGAAMAQFFAMNGSHSVPSRSNSNKDGNLNYIVGDISDVKKVRVDNGSSYQKKQRAKKSKRKGL